MNKEFIPFELALELKELGFDAPCFGYWLSTGTLHIGQESNVAMLCAFSNVNYIKAFLWQQAFDWFRENYFLFGQITIAEYELENHGFEYEIKSKDKSIDTWRGGYKIYEEAELECLTKLIEIVKNGNNNCNK